MSELNRSLLREAIEHWEDNVARVGRGHLPDTQPCSLCREYVDKGYNCAGCPVSAKTGRLSCRETPYVDVTRRAVAMDITEDWEGMLRACEDELKFLNKLLEEEDTSV